MLLNYGRSSTWWHCIPQLRYVWFTCTFQSIVQLSEIFRRQVVHSLATSIVSSEEIKLSYLYSLKTSGDITNLSLTVKFTGN